MASTPLAVRRGVPHGAGGDERLDLDEQRPAALEGRRDDAARRRPVVVGEEGPGRIGDLAQAALAHLEHADLLGRAEAVLGRPQQPQRAVALALERQDRVDEVLEGLRPGERAVLGHVADEDDRDPVALGELHQPERRLADLADAAGRPVELVDGRGLDRVDDEQRRARRRRGRLDDPVRSSISASDADRSAGRPVEQPRRSRAEAELRADSSPEA